MERRRRQGIIGYLRRNPSLAIGLTLIVLLLLFAGVGRLVVDPAKSAPLSARGYQPPSARYPFGTDKVGRDLLAALIVATPLTLEVGLTAGILGVAVATILAFIAAYYGGLVDGVIRLVVDIGLTIPSILILILIAIAVGGVSVTQMALIVASTAWLWPTRTIRAQVLTMKERGYVEVARMSGMSGLEIIFKELMPNLIPFIVASLVTTTASAILASVGLEALGLGPASVPTLGNTIYWCIIYSAVLQGYWWWWAIPTIMIVIIFIGLFLASIGMDELSNPRVRRQV
jgi:peptide/nickel transport system permease protein